MKKFKNGDVVFYKKTQTLEVICGEGRGCYPIYANPNDYGCVFWNINNKDVRLATKKDYVEYLDALLEFCLLLKNEEEN